MCFHTLHSHSSVVIGEWMEWASSPEKTSLSRSLWKTTTHEKSSCSSTGCLQSQARRLRVSASRRDISSDLRNTQRHPKSTSLSSKHLVVRVTQSCRPSHFISSYYWALASVHSNRRRQIRIRLAVRGRCRCLNTLRSHSSSVGK